MKGSKEKINVAVSYTCSMILHYSVEHLLVLGLCWLFEAAQYKLIFNQSDSISVMYS